MCEKESTRYEDVRSRILYTCEEKYDGSMVAYVIELESQLIGLKLEHQQLMDDLNEATGCKYCADYYTELLGDRCRKCRKYDTYVNAENPNNWKWRGMTDQKGSEHA